MNIVLTGCSQGIGFELAKKLGREHKVFCLTRNIKPLKELHKQNIKHLSYDLIQPNSDALDDLLKDVDEISILINNAGVLVNEPFESLSMAQLEHSYKVNLFAPFQLIQKLLPKLKKGKAHIVNVSSMGGVQGSSKFPGLSAYSSSKGALITLTECLAEEYKESGMKFNALALGAVQTEMLEQAFPGYKAPISAIEMAEFISDFALNNGKYMNGKIINVALSNP